MKKSHYVWTLMLILMFTVSGANAAPVSFTLEGKVSTLSGATNPGVNINDQVSLTISYDDDVTHTGFSEYGYRYEANHPVSVSLTAGSWAYSWTTTTAWWEVEDDIYQGVSSFTDAYWLYSTSGESPGIINGDAWGVSTLFSNKWAYYDGIWPEEKVWLIEDDSNGIPEILNWDHMTLGFRTGTNPYGGDLVFRMGFDATAVPLPASIWLLISGMMGLLGVARAKVSRMH